MHTLRQILLRLPIRFGTRSARRQRSAHVRHAQFASFLEQSGYRPSNIDRYQRSLQRWRLGKVALLVAAVTFVAWVAIESAQALTLF